MKRIYLISFLFCIAANLHAQDSLTSGNPILKGWYADPEAAIFKKQYWIYPTFSDKYKNQVFFDAFSSKDLITWKNMSTFSIQTQYVGRRKQCGLLPS